MPPFLASLIAKLGMKGIALIGTGLVIAALLFALHVKNSTIESLRTRNAQTEAKLEISNASIATLKAAIALQNADVEKRAQAYQDSLKTAQRDAVALEKASRQSQGQIDRLKALASRKGESGCKVPAELTTLLDGL